MTYGYKMDQPPPHWLAADPHLLQAALDLLGSGNMSALNLTDLPTAEEERPAVQNLSLVFKYPEPFRITATILHAVLFIFGFVGNIIICLVVKRTRTLHTPTYCYLVSLAVADLILVCSAIPEAILSYHLYSKQWIMGHAVCSLWVFFTFLAFNAGAVSILAFTVERYIAICHPMRSQKVCTVNRARKIIVALWLFVIAYCSPWLYFTHIKTKEYANFQGFQVCEYRFLRETYTIIYTADIVLYYFLPLLVSIVLYSRIGWVIFRSMKSDGGDVSLARQKSRNRAVPVKDKEAHETNRLVVDPPSYDFRKSSIITRGPSPGTNSGSHVDNRGQVVKMLVVVVVSFAVLLGPYRLLLLYNSFASRSYKNLWFFLFCKTLVFMNSTLNPFLYSIFSKKFRLACMRILCCQKRTKPLKFNFVELSVRSVNGDSLTKQASVCFHTKGSSSSRSSGKTTSTNRSTLRRSTDRRQSKRQH